MIFFFLLGLAICVESFKLGIGSLRAPLPGFFPFLTGALLALLSGVRIVSAFVSGKPSDSRREKILWRKVFPLLAGLLAYVLVMDWAGFFLSTFLFIFVVLDRMESKNWWVAGGAALGIACSMHLVFRAWLHVQLPMGFMGF